MKCTKPLSLNVSSLLPKDRICQLKDGHGAPCEHGRWVWGHEWLQFDNRRDTERFPAKAQ